MTPMDVAEPRPRRRELASRLWLLADLVQASDSRRSFRSRAFRTAVWALDDLSPDLHDTEEAMTAVAGVGPGIIRLIDEFRRTGSIAELDRLADLYPSAVARMRRLPRNTPKRLRQLKGMGVDTLADLFDALETGAVETIEGLGPATVDRWIAILALPPTWGAVPAHEAAVTGAVLSRHLGRHLPAAQVAIAGQGRRLEEWVTVLELVAVSDDPEAAVHFLDTSAGVASSAVDPGWGVELVTHSGLPARVHLAGTPRAGSVLVRATGPPEHLTAMELDTTGTHPDEEAVYRAAGHRWVPPPARSESPVDPGALITTDDLRADLHVHSDWSPDGHMTIDSILQAAVDRGYEYLALTDHTVGLRFGSLDPAGLRRQREEIDVARRRHPQLVVLHGAEINIDRDGVPDLDDGTLDWLDFVVAGCHSHFDLDVGEQTDRLVKAIRHPAVRVLAHPTGRRIGIRPGFELDLGTVFETAVATNTALEVNGHRDRMDLSAEWAAAAVESGALLAANSDAHRPPELDNTGVAVGVMQKAGVPPEAVVNALTKSDFLAWAESAP